MQTLTATTTARTTDEIVIKQWHMSGRCAVHSAGFALADARSGVLNRKIQNATIELETRTEQREAVIEIMADYGYELTTFDRDDYGNFLLTFAAMGGGH